MSDHMAITNTYTHKKKDIPNNHTSIKAFRTFYGDNVALCISALKNTDWSSLLNEPDLDSTFQVFLENILRIFEFSFPQKTKTCHCSNKNKKWFSNELKAHRDTKSERQPYMND